MKNFVEESKKKVNINLTQDISYLLYIVFESH